MLVAGRRSVLRSCTVAIVCIAPLLWIHWSRLNLHGHRSGNHLADTEPMWALNPWKQTDLASLFSIGRVDYAGEIIRLHPGFIGFSLLTVAAFARSKFWWSAFLLFTLLALGPEIRWMGSGTGVSNYLSLLFQSVPGYGLINHHGRFMLPALLALSVLVSQGIQRVPMRPLFVVAIVAELTLGSPIGFFVPSTPPINSLVLDGIGDTDGRILRLPASGPGIPFQKALWEQSKHGRPLFLNPNMPGVGTLLADAAWMDRIAFGDSQFPTPLCLPESVSGLLVERDFSEPFVAVLGESHLADQSYLYWASSQLRSNGACRAE